MRLISKLSVRAKINLGIAAIVLVSGMASAALVSGAAADAMTEEIRKRGVNLARNLAARSVEPVLRLDHLALRAIVGQTQPLDDAITYVFLLDRDGEVLAHSFADGFPLDLIAANVPAPGGETSLRRLRAGDLRIYDFASPVTVGDVRIGTARLGLSREAASAAARGLLTLIGSITAVCTVLALAAGSLFAASLSRRIKVLRDLAERIVGGDLAPAPAPPPAVRCWEMQGCALTHCPAHGDDQCRCWLTSGTLCAQDNHRTGSCTACKVYDSNRGDELNDLREVFDVMAFALKGHISALKEKEDIVNRQKRLLKTVFDVTPDLVTLRDENMRYLAANKAFCDFFGVAEADLLGTAGDILPALALTGRGGEGLSPAPGRPCAAEVPVELGPTRRWFHVVKAAVGAADDTQSGGGGLLMTARDITEAKAVRERLVESQKMESLGLLAGGVAHEINTPLAIILGYAEVMQDDAPKSSLLAKALKLIEDNAKVCRKIVADLLDFSRKGESVRQPVDASASVSEVVSLVANIFRQERIRVAQRPGEGLPLVLGDNARLKQVWLNLLNNAKDAAGPEGTVVVETGFNPATGMVRVSVADSGPGIAKMDLDRLFDPFFSTKPVGKGTGLGLSVSFGIVADHGGKITVVSPLPAGFFGGAAGAIAEGVPGPGAMFTVELPAADQNGPSCVRPRGNETDNMG